jgi:predicted nucleic acid-binding protein
VIVVDASAVLEALMRTDAAVDRLADEQLIAPHIIDVEIAAGFRRLVVAQRVDARLVEELFQDLADTEIFRYPHSELLPRAWELRHNVSVYDAVYVALAEALDAPLVTLDRRLAGAPGVRATVEVIPSTN